MMLTVNHIKEKLSQEMPFLQNEYDISSIEIFGSYVKGDYSPESDLDILVSFNNKPGYFKFIELENYLSSVTGLNVDLVVEDALKNYVRDAITSYKVKP